MEPIVDVLVPVHSATRPVARAVASVVDHTSAPVRVSVIAHNIEPARIIANLGDYATHPSVRVLELQDGIPSPAGPYNHGMSQATAPTVAVLGSDDEFQPGALDSWLAVREETGARMVIAPIIYADGRRDDSPPVRWRNWRRLSPVADRLSYRSAPLGLIDREAFGMLRFSEGLGSGEDLVFVARMWFSGERIAYDRRGPGYLGHEDESDRTTAVPRTIAEDFVYLDELFAVVESLGGRRARRAMALKLVRVHVFDAVAARAARGSDARTHRELREVAERIVAWGAGSERYLSIIDRRALDMILDAETPLDADKLVEMFGRRWARTREAVLPRNPLLALSSQAPLRMLLRL